MWRGGMKIEILLFYEHPTHYQSQNVVRLYENNLYSVLFQASRYPKAVHETTFHW